MSILNHVHSKLPQNSRLNMGARLFNYVSILLYCISSTFKCDSCYVFNSNLKVTLVMCLFRFEFVLWLSSLCCLHVSLMPFVKYMSLQL